MSVLFPEENMGVGEGNVSIELGDLTVYNFKREAVSKRTL